ncbi:MAG: hypothetical protein L3J53_05850 [Proteobacteria bacterium]|nr:hypothetical protein [Pseudomonadota bacterium]
MSKSKNILIFLLLISTASTVSAKTKKVNHLEIAQQMINNAYKLDYVDAAPLEMSNIEKKMVLAREAKEKRKKKLMIKLVEQIKVDLRIVKQRYAVNKLHQQLLELQKTNLTLEKTLDEFKAQL